MSITTLFIDIGGVLLTDGWNTGSRLLASQKFGYNFEETESRHRQIFDPFEINKFTLDEYLNKVVFYKKRQFSHDDFKKFMFEQSKPFPQMLNLAQTLKTKNKLKIAVVSNESKELNEYRIKKFSLDKFVDFFISSCIVGLRKPDKDIFRLALEISQVPADQVIYIENTPMFIEIAQELGIKGILHTDYESTHAKLASLNLNI